MTRPPRPKYPSDQKNYHEQRRPGCAHTIRLPEDLLPMYQQLKCGLGSRSTHADVIRFLFEAADAAIQAVLQSAEVRVVADSVQLNVLDDDVIADPDDDPGEIAEDSEESDPETMVEAGRMVGGRDDEVHIVNDSQVHSNVTPASNFYKDAVNGFWGKSKISEFFMQYIVCCPTVNCGRDLEKNHGTPDITGRLYHSSL
ncbi:hypothetical protein R1sor_016446 [Riccia sorocarpa]|uniref:Histone H2A/H2B/H3 domain-containing protein n=1 Tax=Riccia sorocarpa TaxID=122646 RepID=A0ABD3HF23_9MARC